MIADSVENIGRYREIPVLARVISYIEQQDLNMLPEGRTEIDGERLYVMLQHPSLKCAEEIRPEAHDRCCDLQLVLKGQEIMGYAPRQMLGEPLECCPERDISFYRGERLSPVLIREGMFAVFFPEDVHAPCIQAGSCREVTKAVFKIRLPLLSEPSPGASV